MQAGDLRHRVDVRESITPKDTTGAPNAAGRYQTVDTIWADVEREHPESGEDEEASTRVTTVKARIRFRFRDWINETMRLRHDGYEYDIESLTWDAKKTEMIAEGTAINAEDSGPR